MSDFSMTEPSRDIYKTNKIALIDADYIKYHTIWRVAKNIARDQNNKTPEDELINEILYTMSYILPDVECKAMIYCFSGPTKKGFRYKLAQDKEYKGNRKPKTLYDSVGEDLRFIDDYIQANNTHLIYEDCEADDILSMLQCDDTFIYSHDKDLVQVPGTHYNIKTDEMYVVSPEESYRYLMYQSLGGDPGTDNILGLRGWGMNTYNKEGKIKTHGKVEKVLDEVETEDLFNTILSLYVNEYGLRRGIDTYVEMYSLVRLQLDRGKWILEKYADAFALIDSLKLIK